MKMIATALSVSLIAASAAAQVQPVTAPAKPSLAEQPVAARSDLLETLKADGRFTVLLKGLQTTNLAGLVKTSPHLTLFAPTDAAFAKLPPGELERLMQDRPALQRLLTHHLVNAPLKTTKLMGAKGPIPTVAGVNVVIDGSGGRITVDEAGVQQGDVIVSNGVLHVIDQVLELEPPAPAAQGADA